MFKEGIVEFLMVVAQSKIWLLGEWYLTRNVKCGFGVKKRSRCRGHLVFLRSHSKFARAREDARFPESARCRGEAGLTPYAIFLSIVSVILRISWWSGLDETHPGRGERGPADADTHPNLQTTKDALFCHWYSSYHSSSITKSIIFFFLFLQLNFISLQIIGKLQN